MLPELCEDVDSDEGVEEVDPVSYTHLRSGGDSRYGFLCDVIDMWLFSVPLGFLNAFVFNLPPMVVYFVICLDEFVKIPFVYHHYKSYRWLKNITRENV